MSNLVHPVWVIPDLALMICPSCPDPYDMDFYDNYWMFFVHHIDLIREHGFRWLMSDILLTSVLCQFPWSELGKIPWIGDMHIVLEEWQRSEEVQHRLVPPGSDARVDPDIVPTHANSEAKEAWIDILSLCADEMPTSSYIASCSRQCLSCHEVQVLRQTHPAIALPLSCEEQHWDSARKKVDPWYEHELPAEGPNRYIPPTSWHSGQPFPRAGSPRGEGFQDCQSSIWVWDGAEKHWDVQLQPFRRDNYKRVTKDGRLLDDRAVRLAEAPGRNRNMSRGRSR